MIGNVIAVEALLLILFTKNPPGITYDSNGGYYVNTRIFAAAQGIRHHERIYEAFRMMRDRGFICRVDQFKDSGYFYFQTHPLIDNYGTWRAVPGPTISADLMRLARRDPRRKCHATRRKLAKIIGPEHRESLERHANRTLARAQELLKQRDEYIKAALADMQYPSIGFTNPAQFANADALRALQRGRTGRRMRRTQFPHPPTTRKKHHDIVDMQEAVTTAAELFLPLQFVIRKLFNGTQITEEDIRLHGLHHTPGPAARELFKGITKRRNSAVTARVQRERRASRDSKRRMRGRKRDARAADELRLKQQRRADLAAEWAQRCHERERDTTGGSSSTAEGSLQKEHCDGQGSVCAD